MQKFLKKYNINLKLKELEKFKKFLEIFHKKNSKINLSSLRNKDLIIEKHFIDSIMLSVFIDLKWKVADIWTGWGFPLIPLAIINKDVEFIWIDSTIKKLKAVNGFVKELWLNNVITLNWRIEKIWQNPKYSWIFDYVTSRAVAFLPTLLEYSIPLLKNWWILCAYKLDNKEELESAKKTISRLKAKIIKIEKYILCGQKRIIILIKKNN